MSKYIEVDALKEQVRKSHGIRSLEYLLPIEKEIVKEVDSAPSIDIVRCKECKHWHEDDHWWCDIWLCHVFNQDFYCGCGIQRERKGE